MCLVRLSEAEICLDYDAANRWRVTDYNSPIKRNPFGEHSGWLPSSGHVYYFMVSGLARRRSRNNHERINLLRFVWP